MMISRKGPSEGGASTYLETIKGAIILHGENMI
jgi:hypothetical protein